MRVPQRLIVTTTSVGFRTAAGAGMLLLAVAACGGRYLETGDPSYDVAGSASASGGTSSGASQAQAGKSAGGKVSGTGGRADGGSGVGGSLAGAGTGAAGATSSAGTAGGCAVACPLLSCPVGYGFVRDADGCCYHCELDLAACKEQRIDYQRYREQVIEKFSSVGCQVASDCSVYYEKNNCGSGCGIAIPTQLVQELDATLTSFAQSTCAPACPNEPTPPCDSLGAPSCVSGFCQ